jgi:predicted adenylyl cyclase CyaB
LSRNVEIKARIESIETLTEKAIALADEGPIEILQDDTFFRCDAGRLKLRDFTNGTGELIFYQRQNLPGPKESLYVISPTAAPELLRQALSMAYGQAGRVRKHRTLFLAGRTRIHLDRVEQLGDFMELEVVLEEGESAEVGIREAQHLMEKLNVGQDQLVTGAYVDMLHGQGR